MKRNALIVSAVLLLLGVLTAAAPYSFAPVCELGEKVMKCRWTARAELFLGIEIALLALLRLLAKDKAVRLGLNAGIAASAAGVVLFPSLLIGVCGMASMHCHSVTKPTLIVLGIVTLVVVLADSVFSLIRRN